MATNPDFRLSHGKAKGTVQFQGFFYGNLGPALPDIQLLTGKGLDDVSWLFTATNAGSLLGTLVCGQFVDRAGPQLVLFVSLSTASALTVVFIYCSSFTAMLVVRGFTGIFIGCVDLCKSNHTIPEVNATFNHVKMLLWKNLIFYINSGS